MAKLLLYVKLQSHPLRYSVCMNLALTASVLPLTMPYQEEEHSLGKRESGALNMFKIKYADVYLPVVKYIFTPTLRVLAWY